ncbi:MAG TPA: hypothetical protein VNC84_00160 [Gammaproteobacteria bacterium]|nr:hypothetical protein [Gammaproteobacteria bacterium]
MAAMETLCQLIGIDLSRLSREELTMLEAEIFLHVCKVLEEKFRIEHREFFRVMQFSQKKEDAMLDQAFVGLVIKDILSTREYSLKGVAAYTGMHEDILQEVVDGRNTNPSAVLLRRAIELHRFVRKELYQSIVKKMMHEARRMQ